MLAVVVRRNQTEAASHLAQELFESWRQLVETSLHAMLQDHIKRELKVAVLFELIQDLLIKVCQLKFSASVSPDQSQLLSLINSPLPPLPLLPPSPFAAGGAV